jgi:predicted nucleic acid-binding protein
VACDAVWAEVTAGFPEEGDAEESLRKLGLGYVACDREAAALAGRSWRTYRQEGGERRRVIADFLIGAHALAQAERLLTRDRGFYRRCFGELAILDPSAE